MKFVEAVNNFAKLAEVRKNFKKFMKLANNLMKFMGLANNFQKVCKTRKNFMKCLDWKVGFKCLRVFSLFQFHSFKYFGKHKCFVNTFHK